MPSIINSSTSSGLITTGSTDGALALQTAGTTALTISSAQVVSLTNALPVTSGGTGLTALGSANQVLGVNSGGTALAFSTISTTPTTAQVLTATSGLTFGDVGSYAFLGQQTASALQPGNTQAGSELRFAGISAGQAPGNTGLNSAKGSSTNLPSGTWRCLGYADGGSNYYYTLFLRIS
jgi:hypothetical protein